MDPRRAERIVRRRRQGDGGDRRRVGLGQERHRPLRHAAHSARERPHRGQHQARGPRSADAARTGDAGSARQRRRHDLPGADDQPQSGADHRLPDRRGADLSPRHVARGGRGRDYSSAGEGPHSGGEVAFPRISASLLRRHAPARDDRHGAGLQAEAADRRRADHRARRHDPGADPGAAQGSAAGRGYVDPLHHPRYGRRCRNRRPHRGDV